jgi:hypothetical protein
LSIADCLRVEPDGGLVGVPSIEHGADLLAQFDSWRTRAAKDGLQFLERVLAGLLVVAVEPT